MDTELISRIALLLVATSIPAFLGRQGWLVIAGWFGALAHQIGLRPVYGQARTVEGLQSASWMFSDATFWACFGFLVVRSLMPPSGRASASSWSCLPR